MPDPSGRHTQWGEQLLTLKVDAYEPVVDASRATGSVTHIKKPANFTAYYSVPKTGGYDKQNTLEAAEKEARLILRELATGSFVIGRIDFMGENIVGVGFDVHYKTPVNASVSYLEIDAAPGATNSQIAEAVQQELTLFFSEAVSAARV